MTARRWSWPLAATIAVLTVTTLAAPASAHPGTTGRPARQPGQAATTGDAQTRLPAPPRPPVTRPQTRAVTATAAGTSPTSATAAGTPAAPGRPAATAPAPRATSGGKAPGAGSARTLVLYDSTSQYAWLGEAYAMLTANLVSHFGTWTAHPVAGYTARELTGYTAVVYLGSTYDEPIPTAFLDDVLATQVPVLWAYDNIWQLTARSPQFATARGFTWNQFDFAAVAEVRYHGGSLTRDATNAAGLMQTTITDPGRATVLADAVRANGTTLPWAVRAGNLTYVTEIPFAYVTHDDRYLAFADLLFDLLAPKTAARHRALVRIEDVGPDADPATLRAIGDSLYRRRVPFTVAVYPRYRDPKGTTTDGRPQDYTLWQRPAVVSALKYLQSRGGTLLMHGYTHQYGTVANPYDGVSGNDFEFYQAHIDASDQVVYDGPVPGDSSSWATGRLTSAAREFTLAGLSTPTMFEFPHYAGSAVDYQAVVSRFAARYDRGLYFPGQLSGGARDATRAVGQYFPYAVRDVYGSAVVPENIGNVEVDAANGHPARLPADLLASARRNLLVRDGVASFFYHPYLGTAYLNQLVDGAQGLGYTFVSAAATLAS